MRMCGQDECVRLSKILKNKQSESFPADINVVIEGPFSGESYTWVSSFPLTFDRVVLNDKTVSSAEAYVCPQIGHVRPASGIIRLKMASPCNYVEFGKVQPRHVHILNDDDPRDVWCIALLHGKHRNEDLMTTVSVSPISLADTSMFVSPKNLRWLLSLQTKHRIVSLTEDGDECAKYVDDDSHPEKSVTLKADNVSAARMQDAVSYLSKKNFHRVCVYAPRSWRCCIM